MPHLHRMAEFRRSVMNLLEESLGALEPESFYARILEQAVRVIPGAQAGSVLLRGADGRFAFAATVGYDLEALRGIRLDRAAAAFGNRRSDDHPRVIVRPRTHAEVPTGHDVTLRDVGRSDEIAAVLVVPILVDGALTAFLSVDNFETEAAFGDEALEMARVFAGHMGSLVRRFALERELHRLAYHDALTGLANRARLVEHLETTLRDAGTTGTRVTVLFVDLDNLKPVNDSLGHRGGDAVLTTVAARMTRLVPAGALLARLSGDEFIIVLSEPHDSADAARLAERILAAIAEPIEALRHVVHVSASIGIGVHPDDASSADDLLRRADIAMYHAKKRGKNAYSSFLPEMDAAPLDRLRLEEALRQALDEDQFVLHYQPRVDVRSGRIVSLEALVRWEHPERGLIPPGLFIPLAEDTNLIHPLGKRIFEMAARQARDWRAAGFPGVRVAVNLSARQLERADLVDEVRETLAEARLPACALEIEVLESVAMEDVTASIGKLDRLKELGVRIALDDFGTGYSSLSYLQELPLDLLKIDRTFLKGADGEPVTARNQGVLRAVLALGTTFDLRVVAEGVETREQWEHLRAIGCHEAQGYFLSRPVPASGVLPLLQRGTLGAAAEATTPELGVA